MNRLAFRALFVISIQLPLGSAWAQTQDAKFRLELAKQFCEQLIPQYRSISNEPGKFAMVTYKGWLMNGMNGTIQKGNMTPEEKKMWDIALNDAYPKYYNYVMSNCPY